MTNKEPILTEEQEQEVIFEWAAYSLSRWPELGLLHHIPNGGYRAISTAARLRRQGVKPGVPDICLPVPRCGKHGLYIELKRLKNGRVSPEQKNWLEALENQGYAVAVCHGSAEAIQTIEAYMTEDGRPWAKLSL